MINESSERQHRRHNNMCSDEKLQKTSNCEKDSYDPYEMESRMKAQIERNNEWIEKMSPVVKYKIQEYIRKQRVKKMQRRKFSLACGLNHRMRQESMPPPQSSSSSSSRRRSKKPGDSSRSEYRQMPSSSSAPMLERNLSQPESSDHRKSASVSNRRKSAPAQKMDMRDLDDLE